MNLSYKCYSTKKSSKLLLRIYRKDFDLSVALELSVTPDMWSQENQSFKDNSLLNAKLLELKLSVLNQYNNDYVQGILIDKTWLQKTIASVFSRPSEEKGLVNLDHKIYLSDFSKHWLENKAEKWKVSHNKTMGLQLKAQYENFLKLLVRFEVKSSKIVMKDISSDTIYSFVEFMEQEGYSVSKIDREVGRFRFMCNRAIEDNIRISNDFQKRIFLDKRQDESEGVYLNEDELEQIFNLDLNNDYHLENARDNFIISCFSGIRVSDLRTNLNTDNIKDGIISVKTQKTGQFTKIPVHNYVRMILNKRFGNLPATTTVTVYNKQLKEICRLAGIDSQVYSTLWNPTTKRKEKGYFFKWQLISSHKGRISFVSNLKGKVSDEVLMSVGAWKTKEMMSHYSKTSKQEYADKLNEYWNG